MGGELIQSQATKIKLCLGNAFVCSYWGAGDGLGPGWNGTFWRDFMLPNVSGDTNYERCWLFQ